MRIKFFFYTLFITIILPLYSDEIIFKPKKEFIIKDNIIHQEYSFNEKDFFTISTDDVGIGVDTEFPLKIEFRLYSPKYEENMFISTEEIEPNANIQHISENVKKDYWIPSYYYNLLKSHIPLDDVLKYEKYWSTKIIQSRYDEDITWKDEFSILKYYFGDFYFVVFGRHVYNDVDFFAYLEEVSDNKIIYNVQRMYSHFFDYKEGGIYNQPEFLPLFEKATPFKIIFIIDGDYMKMYIDEVSENNLFQTLVRTTPEACNQIENYIKGDSRDLSKVVMPKHGNKSVQTPAASSTNVTTNKTMTVSENLKLRSGEATSTKVLTVMSAGTKVKILELGKAETIDGINSNWVKVEVQSGAKDRDGKPIKAGTVGWCYGGYLE